MRKGAIRWGSLWGKKEIAGGGYGKSKSERRKGGRRLRDLFSKGGGGEGPPLWGGVVKGDCRGDTGTLKNTYFWCWGGYYV